MPLQLSTTARNARLDSIESTCGTSAVMKIFTGSIPANCASVDSGTVLATVNLPVDWMSNAVGGSKSKSGIWEDLSADNTGIAGYFRIYDSGVTVCHIQGTVGTTGADMIVNTLNFTAGQAFTVNTFTITDGNA